MKTASIPVKNFPKSGTFILRRLEELEHNFVSKPHRHDFYEVLLFLNKGHGHHIDFIEYPVEQNTIFFLAPGTVHHMCPFARQGYLLAFDQNFLARSLPQHSIDLTRLFRPDPLNRRMMFSDTRLQYILPLLELMERHYQDKNYLSILYSYLHSFLILCSTENKESSKISDSVRKSQYLVDKVLHLIDAHYQKERTTDFYTAKVNLSSKRLNQVLRHHTNQTLNQLIAERLILEIKRELFFQKVEIKEVAYQFNFSDLSYFYRFFKKHTQMTPQEFQAQSSQ